MNVQKVTTIVIALSLMVVVGCRDNTPPPHRTPVPSQSERGLTMEYDIPKPLPGEERRP